MSKRPPQLTGCCLRHRVSRLPLSLAAETVGEVGLKGSVLVSRGEDDLGIVVGEDGLGDLGAFADFGPRWCEYERQKNESGGKRDMPARTMRTIHGIANRGDGLTVPTIDPALVLDYPIGSRSLSAGFGASVVDERSR